MRASSQSWRVRALIAAIVVSFAAVSMASCGDSGGKHRAQATRVTGVAATGAPIANATVTMKDASGKSANATTAVDGSFSIASKGLKPPFLVRVAAANGNLYSVSADDKATTTINVTTLTDLATRAWYAVNGMSSLDPVFENPSGIARPTPTQVQDVEELIDSVFVLWLEDAGVDPTKSNLISTPFKADGTGVDKVLGQTSVNGWVINVTGPASAGVARASLAGTAPRPAAAPVERAQVTTLSFDANEKTVTVESEVTAGAEVSTSVATTVVSTSSAMDTAFQQIDANIRAWGQVVDQKEGALTADDLMPFMDPEAMGQGLNAREGAELWAAQGRTMVGMTVSAWLDSLDELDTVNGTAHGYIKVGVVDQGVIGTNKLESRFRLVDGKWLVSGDGRPGYMYVKVGGFTGIGGSSMEIEASADTREGAYVASTVSGGQWSDVPMNQSETTTVDEAGHKFRGFMIRASVDDPASLPPAGTPFTFKLQPVSGPQEQWVVKMNAATNAMVWLTSAPEGSAADIIGQTVTLAWTLPTTVVIDEVNLQGAVYGGPPDSRVTCDIWGDPLSTTATSGSITILPTCDGLPVDSLYLSVNVEGVNGEEISAMREYY